MRYVNKVTGNIIDVESELKGGGWEPLEKKAKAQPEAVDEVPEVKPAKKKGKK